MKRLLDELAASLHGCQGGRAPRRVHGSADLKDQFGLPITPSRWAELSQQLTCRLPPLERRSDGLWSFPRGWTTVWDMGAYVAERHPDWQPRAGGTVEDWVEAQVFVGVRDVMVEALNVDEEEVVRSARLQQDLGAE